MSDTVDLIATRDFSYKTRRLRAGDDIPGVSERDARILIAIGKAKHARQSGKVAPPPSEVTERAAAATPQKTTAVAAEGSAVKPTARATTRKRTSTRKATAKKG